MQIPYLISYFDGNKAYSFYLTDYVNSSAMIKACLRSIINNEAYNKYKIYAHNLAAFDGVFLLKNLIELGEVTPIINNGNLISIGFKKNNFKLEF